MPLPEDLREQSEIAASLAQVLAEELGDASSFTIGAAEASISEALRDDRVRSVLLSFSIDGTEGSLALVAVEHFAQTLEHAASDELLLSTATAPLEAAAHKLAEVASLEVEMDAPREIDLAALTALLAGADLAVFPILAADDVVACAVLATHGVAAGDSGPSGVAAETTSSAAAFAATPLVLADVEMGVTAELGRTEMTLRELLSLTPGAVIDLDRAAGAPVDVLVNGTLIARGEVVVIDEEFGIRISEILTSAPSA